MFGVANTLICDHVRREYDGKYTCLGIYPNSSVVVPDFVVPVKLSFYVEIFSTLYQTIDAHFILEDRISNIVFSSFPSRLLLNGWSSPPLATLPIEIKARGPATVHFSAIAGDQKVELTNFTISQIPPPPPIA